jgi:hypothetical protein
MAVRERGREMNGQRIRRISIWLVASLYLLACALPLMTTPTVPTQMPVGIVIAQTAAAAQTQTSIFLPTITLTPTPTPTFTPTRTPTSTPTLIPPIVLPFLFTATPTVTFVITQAGTASSNSSNGGTGEDEENNDYDLVKDKEWACTVLQRSPADGAVIGSGVRFSAVWTLLNRGTKTWPNYGVDFLFKAGLRNDGRARYDLPSTVISGGTITLDVTIIAPKDPGAYRSIWTLKVGHRSFCKMGINFVVQ